MENNLNRNLNSNTNSTVALPANPVVYGTASSLGHSVTGDGTAVSLGFWSQVNYLYGEYLKGIFFVIASTVFILAIPVLLTKPGKLALMFRDVIKRTVDIIGALSGLILSAPVWLILPFLIKLDSSGSVFYIQVRVGRNRRSSNRRYCQRTDVGERRNRDRRRENFLGQPFKLIKFRTMIQNAESKSGPIWASKNDPRITRLGAFMRKTRMDEIPQLLCVLMGDMSLIGPRPERPHFVSDLSTKIDNYTRRLELKPGLTGFAQVEGGYDSSLTSVIEKVRRDVEYIDNWSLWMDIKILLRTVIVVLTGRGAC